MRNGTVKKINRGNSKDTTGGGVLTYIVVGTAETDDAASKALSSVVMANSLSLQNKASAWDWRELGRRAIEMRGEARFDLKHSGFHHRFININYRQPKNLGARRVHSPKTVHPSLTRSSHIHCFVFFIAVRPAQARSLVAA